MRQSRHLLVSNLPENITEDRVLDHFKRFGKVQSVKILASSSITRKGGCNDTQSSSVCATVAFIDIRSAAKALNNPDNKIEEKVLKTEYYEPPASSTSSSAIFIHETREDALLVQRQSSSSSSLGNNSVTTSSCTSNSSQLGSSTSCTVAYNNSSSNVGPNNNSQITPASISSSSSVPLLASSSHGSNAAAAASIAPATTASTKARTAASSSSFSSSITSCSSSSQRLHHLTTSRSSCGRESAGIGSNNSQIHQASSHTIGGNGTSLESCSVLDRDYDHHKSFSTSHAICVRNLPVRSSDTSLKDGLYHEYKKHGKVTLVKVVGSGSERFAVVCFKKPEDVEKALEVSKDKLFFGCKIEVTAKERSPRRPLWNSTDTESKNSFSHSSSPGKSRSQIQSMSPPPPGTRNSSDKDCKRIIRTPRSPASSRSSSVGGDGPESDLISRKSSLEDGADFQKENQKRFSSGSLSLSHESISDPRDTHKRRLEDDADSSSDDPDQKHQERKKRLLACIEPKNISGKDRPATSSSRTSFDGVRSNSGNKTSQSIESNGDDLAEEVLEIVRNKQINLKDVTDRTLMTILERLSAENVDASRSSSDGSDSRPSRSQGERKKGDKSYPRVNLTDDRVNPNLTDPRRRPPCETWLINATMSPSSHLLNPSCRDHSSLKRQQNISEPSVDSTGMSSPKDVSSSSLKSECDDLVSSSSDRPPAKTPMILPLPEFAVLILGATTFNNSSTPFTTSSKLEHLIPGSIQTVIAPLVIHGHPSISSSPKNISITSPLNTFSPLPGKRLRESTDSKGSEVSTSDRDSLETGNDVTAVVKHETSIEYEKCSSPTKGSTVISGDLSIEDRIRALDKVFTAWSSNAGPSAGGGGGNTTVAVPAATTISCPVPIGMRQEISQSHPAASNTIDYSKYHIKKKSQANAPGSSGDGSSRNEPSEIGKFFMSKTSIFDQDSKRLEHINEKYEPKDSTESAPAAASVQRTVVRTKAEAKEFAPPTDRTLSSSFSEQPPLSSSSSRSKERPNVHPSHSSHPSLGSIQRKLSEPSKMPISSNVKSSRDAPSTPQSAPAKPGSSSAFSLFPSTTPTAPSSSLETVPGKNAISVKKEGQSTGTSESSKGQQLTIREPKRESHPTESKAGLVIKKESTTLPANAGQSSKKDSVPLGGKDSKGNVVPAKQSLVSTSSTTSNSSNSSGTSRGPLNVASHAKSEPSAAGGGKSSNTNSKSGDSDSVSKGRRVSNESGENVHPSKSTDKVKSKPMMMGLSKESLENSTKKKASEGKSASFESSKTLNRTTSFEKSLKKFEAKNVSSDSKNGKVSSGFSKNPSSDSKGTELQSKSSFKDKQKQLMEKSKLRAAKLKEKQKEKEKAEEKKRKNRKYASELKKLGIDISDVPVFHSMYDKVKQRSCQKSVAPPEPSPKLKSDSKSKHDDSSDSSDSDSSSSSSDESEKSPKTKKTIRKRVIAESSSRSSSSSSSSDEKVAKSKSKTIHSGGHGSSKISTKAPRKVVSDSDSDDGPAVKTVKSKKSKKNMKQSKAYSSDDSSSNSDRRNSRPPVVKKAKMSRKSSSSEEDEIQEKKSKSGLDMSKVKKQQMLMKEKMMKKSLEKSSSGSSSKNLLSPSKGIKSGDMREGKSGKSSSFSSLSMLKRLKEQKKVSSSSFSKEAKKEKEQKDRSKSESEGKSHSESKLSAAGTKSGSIKKIKLSDFKKSENEKEFSSSNKKEKMVSEKKPSSSSRDKNISFSSSSSSEKHNSSDNEMRSDFSDSERKYMHLIKVMQSDSETENNSAMIRTSKHSHSKSSMSSGVVSQTEWERSECGKSSSSHHHQSDISVSPTKSSHSNTGFKSPKKTALFSSAEIQSDKEMPSSSKVKREMVDERKEKKGQVEQDGSLSPSSLLQEKRKSISSSPSLNTESNLCHRSSPTPVVSSTSDILSSKLDFNDDSSSSSSSSSEDKLNEDLSKEARLSAERAEHLAESDASNDDLIISDPTAASTTNKDRLAEERQNRRFEVEAAIESQRLEKMMYKDWKESPARPVEDPFNFNHEDEDREASESDANSIFSNDFKHGEIKEQSLDDASTFDDVEPRVTGGKETEVDQRLIEEASAVTALLQEMEYPPEISTETEAAVDNIPYIGLEADDEQHSLPIAEESEGDVKVQPEKVALPVRRSSLLQEGVTTNVEGLESGQVIKSEHQSGIQHTSSKSLSPTASGLESFPSTLLDVTSTATKRTSVAHDDLVNEEKHKLVLDNKCDLDSAVLLPEQSDHASQVKPVAGDEVSSFEQQYKQDSDVGEDGDSSYTRDDLKSDEQKDSERPRRGRRAKTPKFAESSINLPRYESSCNDASGTQKVIENLETMVPATTMASTTVTPCKRPGKASIPADKIRRSPRVAGLIEPETSQQEIHDESGDDGTVFRNSGAEDHPEDGEGQKKKRGRKKKVSGDVPKPETIDSKAQKERLIMSIPISSDKMERKNHLYDVFEFRDSDDEMPPPLPLEVIHPKVGEVQKIVVDEKKPVEETICKQEVLVPENDEPTEAVHPKLSITIRLHQKEGIDGNSGTAEVIKTSKALNPDSSKTTTVTSTTVTAPVIIPTPVTVTPVQVILGVPPSVSMSTQEETAAAEQAKAIRKSARLMSQNKSTVDEVIEDVIKGMNKEGPEGFSARLRRLSRMNRRSEDFFADIDEELLEDPDSRDGKSGAVKSYRVTRSSTRGSTGSEESESHFAGDETFQITQRRHSHPTPSKITENAGTRSSLEQEQLLETESTSRKERDVEELQKKESEEVSVIQEATSNASPDTISGEQQVTITPVTTNAAQPTITKAEVETVQIQREIVPPPTVIPVTQTTSVIQEPARNVVIPSISERIHNSTTALKLKTGKGFILDETSSEYYRGPSEQLTGKIGSETTITATTISTGISGRNVQAETGNSEKVQSFTSPSSSFEQKSVVQPPPAHTKITIEPKQSSIPASVVISQSAHLDKSKIVLSQPEQLLMRPPTASEITEILNNPTLSQQEKQYLLGRFQQQQLERIGSPVILQAPTASSPAAGSAGNVAQLPPQSLSGGLHPRPGMAPPTASSSSAPHLPTAGHLHPEALGPFGFPQMMYGNHPFPIHPNSPHEIQARAMQLRQSRFPSLQHQSPVPDPSRKDKDDKNRKVDARVLMDYRAMEEEQRRHQDSMPPPVITGLRMPLPGYTGGLDPRHPALLSPHDRFTDSPAVIHGYQSSRGLPPSALGMHIRPEGMDVPIHVSPAAKNDDRRGQQQSQPYSSHLQPEQPPRSHGLPPIGSPAPGFLDIRPAHQSALSPGAHPYQRSNIPSPMQSLEDARKTGSRQGFAHKDVNSPLSLNLNSPHGHGFNVHPGQIPDHREEGLLRRAYPSPHMPSEASLPPLGPPPAHVPAPISQPMMAPQTFPQAQVPSGGDSFLLQRYPVVWQGLLALKNDQAAVQMHFISGSKDIAQASLPPILPEEGVPSPVRISQRMRLEPTQLEGVAKKMQSITEHCILLALPCGRDHMDVLQQSNNLRNGFINYLQSKQAAGIVNSSAPGSQTHAYVIHIFPSSDFSSGNMARIAPDLLHVISDIAHLMIVIATV